VSRRVLEIYVGERVAVLVANNQARIRLLDGQGGGKRRISAKYFSSGAGIGLLCDANARLHTGQARRGHASA